MTSGRLSSNVQAFSTLHKGKDQFFENLTDQWLTSREAAKLLKVSISRLMNMCSNGQIPYYKLERSNRYRLNELQDLLMKSKRGGY